MGLNSHLSPFSSVQNSFSCAPPTAALPDFLNFEGRPFCCHAVSTVANSAPFLPILGSGGLTGLGCGAGFGVAGLAGAVFFLPPCFSAQAACLVSMLA